MVRPDKGGEMAGTMSVEAYRKGYLAVLETTVERSQGYFLEPESSLFEILATVSAEEASRPVGSHGTTLAALVNHVRFYIDARNDDLRSGEQHPVDWPSSWQIGAVTEEEWRALVARLRAAYEEQRAFIQKFEDWDEWQVGDAFALVAHCAYHLGEIRLMLGLLRR